MLMPGIHGPAGPVRAGFGSPARGGTKLLEWQRLGDCRGILIVRVGVDDDVGSGGKAGIEAGGKGPREPLMAIEAHDVVDAMRPLLPQAAASSGPDLGGGSI